MPVDIDQSIGMSGDECGTPRPRLPEIPSSRDVSHEMSRLPRTAAHTRVLQVVQCTLTPASGTSDTAIEKARSRQPRPNSRAQTL